MLFRFNTTSVHSPCTEAFLHDACFSFPMRKGLIFDLVPYLRHRRTPDQFGKHTQLMVHLLQLRSDGEDQLDALLLCHLLVKADLTDVVQDATLRLMMST